MSDEVGIASCGPQMVSDEELRNAVDIVGYHYNTNDDSQGNFTRLAEEFDIEIWNSEAQATFGSTADRPNNNMADGGAVPGTGIGGNGGPLEMADTVIKGFVNSRRTHFVYQPTFGAFYEGTQYNYKDVMAARDPWSGYVNYDAALNIMQHFTKFAVTGWEYDTPDENVVWRALPSASKSTATGTNPVNGRNGGDPATIIGDYRWTNYKVSVDLNLNSTSDYLILGARQRGAAGGGDNKVTMSAYNLALNRSGSWILRRYGSEIARGTVDIDQPASCNIAIRAAGDTITAYIEDKEVYTYVDENPQLEGRVMLGTTWNGNGEFDNLKVETVPGYTPYYAMVHDNLHMKKWGGEDAGSDALVYEGNWSHVNQKGSNYSQRSLSSTSQIGASVSYEFTGTGFALISSNGGSAKVNVAVDGETIYTNAPTIATSSHQPYFVVRGLENGEHKVTVSLAGGTLDVDSFAYIAADEIVSSSVDLSELENILTTMEKLDEDNYDPDSWKDYQDAVQAAGQSRYTLETVQKILSDPVAYGADQEGVNEVVDHFNALLGNLLSKDAPVEILSLEEIPEILSVPVDGTIDEVQGRILPKTVKVRKADGTEDDAAEMIWQFTGNTNTAYTSTEVVGTVVGGKNLTVKIPVEIIPSGLVYFIDPGTEDTTVYHRYKTVAPDLLNETNDKLSENGSWGRNKANIKANTNAKDKLDTGIYSGSNIVYTLPLEAGIYTLTAGFTEWWGYGRDVSQTIAYTLSDGTVKTISGDAVSFGAREKTESSTTFVLPEDAVVSYTLAKTKDQDSVISWLAVAKMDEEESKWTPVFASNETNAWAGLLTQGTVVTQDDPEQGEVLHMNAAGTTYVQLDPKAINLTSREKMTMSFDLKSETADGNFFTVAIGQDSSKYFYLRTRKGETHMAITKGSWGSLSTAAIVILPEHLITLKFITVPAPPKNWNYPI